LSDVTILLTAILSLIGSCEAIVTHLETVTADFIDRLITQVQALVDGQLLVGIESLLSSINKEAASRKSSSASTRSHGDPQLQYLLRINTRYTNKGEPLGALMIQRLLLKLLEHTCYISCQTTKHEQLGFLPLKGFKDRFSILSPTVLFGISELAESQIGSIEASADFLKFKTSPHQDLSLSLKATSLRLACITFICGYEVNINLPSVIKSILVDPTQMAHDDLGPACLDSLAAISMNCHEHASDLNRSLRNYIIHAHDPHSTNLSARVCIAAKRLAWCLSTISNDKIVSTLYSLVNVLTSAPSSTNERGATSLQPRTALSLINFDHRTVASSISLSLKTEDQRQQVFSNVVEAIAEIVYELKDEKIAELMISLLGQKFGRVNDGVDKSLVWGLAKISTIVKEKDYKRILKLHAKVRLDPATANTALTETVLSLFRSMLTIDHGCSSVHG
jgi:hypothetical protein